MERELEERNDRDAYCQHDCQRPIPPRHKVAPPRVRVAARQLGIRLRRLRRAAAQLCGPRRIARGHRFLDQRPTAAVITQASVPKHAEETFVMTAFCRELCRLSGRPCTSLCDQPVAVTSIPVVRPAVQVAGSLSLDKLAKSRSLERQTLPNDIDIPRMGIEAGRRWVKGQILYAGEGLPTSRCSTG